MYLKYLGLVLILLCSRCIGTEQIYSPLEAGGCLPSIPCKAGCLEYKALDSTPVTVVEKRGCNQTDASTKYCQCQSNICYRLKEFCLITCEQRETEATKACIACLEKLPPLVENKNTESSSSCSRLCKGMCADFDCGLNMTTTKEKSCSTCAPGYKGESCSDRCSPGCSGKCHPQSGYCLDCPPGKYGPECELACSRGCLFGNCSTSWGTCEACELGYSGADCNTPCSEGFYGRNCSKRCSETCKGGYCDSTKGSCLKGCKPGYFGLRCSQTCPRMTYGEGCLSECPVTCSDSVPCHHETGACVSGCVAGFQGTHCNRTCEEQRYGVNCDFNCSDNCFRQLCNSFSGICLTCIEPFYGPMCEFRIDLDNIHEGVLGSETTSGEAIMMVSGLGVLGVLMWVAVSYLLLNQRKRILKDAAKGIDPRTTQWGMFPNSRAFKEATRLYDSKMEQMGGGDAGTTSKRRRRKDTKRRPYSGNRTRRKKMVTKALKEAKKSRHFLWWSRPESEKPSPPNAVEVEQVSKWLARYHGIEHTGKQEGAIRIAESAKDHSAVDTFKKDETATQSNTGIDSGGVKVTEQSSKESQMMAAKEESRESTSCAEKEKEETIEPSQSRTGQEATNLPTTMRDSQETHVHLNQSQTFKEQTTPASLTQSLQDQTQSGTSLKPSYEYIGNNIPIRKDAIVLSPKAHPWGPNVSLELNYQNEISKSKWIKERLHYSSGNTRPRSTSSEEDASGATTSTSSRSATSSSSSSLSTSGSTLTETNTFRQANRDDSDFTSSGDTSDSSTSDESEGDGSGDSSLSTVIVAQRGKNTYKHKRSLQDKDEAAAGARIIMKDADTDTGDEAKAPGIFRRLVDVFKRAKPKFTQAQPVAQKATSSVPGAGGLPRPFSHKFILNRLETWSRNRGREVTPNDGMLEVAGGLDQKKISRRARPDKKVRLPEESSWISSDVSEETQDKGESSFKPTSRSTDVEPKTTTTAASWGKHDSTSEDDILSDIPTTLV